MDTDFAFRFFGALFAVLNPLAALPIFLGLSEGMSTAEQRATAVQITLYCTVMCAVLALGGQQILSFFQISLAEFRVAGGLLLAGIALHMVTGGDNPAHEGNRQEQAQQKSVENIAFYPMTFPMIVGPGVIATLILFVHEATTRGERISYAAVVAANMAIIFVIFFFAGAIGKRLSAKLRGIMLRLMGMIVMSIAIGMMTAGLGTIFPGLTK